MSVPKAVGPYSPYVKSGNVVFYSGQIGIDPTSGEIPAGFEEQLKQVMENIQSVVHASGYNMDKIVKTTVLITDMDNYGKMNEIYESYFKNRKPARSCFEVSRLPKNALVEIEVVAEI